MATKLKLALSMIATIVAGFMLYSCVMMGWGTAAMVLSFVALAVSVVFCMKFMAADAVPKNKSEEEILAQEQFQLQAKLIKKDKK